MQNVMKYIFQAIRATLCFFFHQHQNAWLSNVCISLSFVDSNVNDTAKRSEEMWFRRRIIKAAAAPDFL
jgi:hypothetical protein